MFLITLVAAIVAAFLVHEAGHFLAGLCFGRVITFRFAWGSLFRIKVPRLIWDMPNHTPQHQRLIALSGFGAEIFFAPLLYLAGLWLYPWVVVVHLMTYPFYAGEANDWKWLDGFAGISKCGWMWVDILTLCGVFWWGIYKIIMKVI